MYNAVINELYLVQISGLWVSSLLLNTHCSSIYIKLQTGSQGMHTVTFTVIHIAPAITKQCDLITTKDREGIYLHVCQVCLQGNKSLNNIED